MPKPRYKTAYNKALIHRGSLTFWIDEIAEWKQNKQGKRGRLRRFSDLAITTALMVKPKKLQCSGWRDLRNDQALHKLTGFGIPETQPIA